MVYYTTFRLTPPVNDLREAQRYLRADNMWKYLPERLKNKISAIEWKLEEESFGVILAFCNAELTKNELAELSDWVKGQNSDGLGEGFEQQDFAMHDEGDCYAISSFDWEVNDYIFKLSSIANVL